MIQKLTSLQWAERKERERGGKGTEEGRMQRTGEKLINRKEKRAESRRGRTPHTTTVTIFLVYGKVSFEFYLI